MTSGGRGGPAFYVDALERLARSDIPFLVGGALALGHYTRIDRQTKDLDLFLHKADVERALDLFRRAGYGAELRFPHWLGKVHCGDQYVDLIFSSGNGVAVVDHLWFEHAVEAEILGVRVRLSPPEEMIWSKAFVQERERFDGADVHHLFYRFGPTLDWQRLLDRFGAHWRVLLAHIIMFGFVYPGRKRVIPGWVTDALLSRLATEPDDYADHVCNGTLLSREQYAFDLDALRYDDARVKPRGHLTPDEIDIWTAAIEEDK
jgi:hypothetical protein